MPFKTRYGTHYHMTEGCHGATIHCDTNGLTPCADCCGGADGGSALAGGSPVVGTGSHGPTQESMEAADRWRSGATDAMFGGGIDLGSVRNRGTGMTYDEWKTRREEEIQHDADAELEAMMAAADSPDYDFDEMADDAFPFGDGGRYSLYGSSDSFPDDGDWDAYRGTRASDAISKAGMGGMADGMEMPGGMATDDIAIRMAQSDADGIRPEDWDGETRRLAEVTGIPESSDGKPTVMMGRIGQLRVFETSHTSTHNPNDDGDRFGEWLYDVKSVHVVAPDGTDLTDTIKVAGNLRKSIANDEERFMDGCRREAREVAGRHRNSLLQDERDRLTREAREHYEQTVTRPWNDGYDSWRKEHEGEATAMAEKMRADRPEWRHRYIPGDVEERMRKRYEKGHPRPRDFELRGQDWQVIEDEAARRTDEALASEGWDYDAEYDRALSDVMGRRDPSGNRGVSPAMRRNYDAAMGKLSGYSDAEGLVGAKLTWGASLGVPVKTPDEWRRRLGQR